MAQAPAGRQVPPRVPGVADRPAARETASAFENRLPHAVSDRAAPYPSPSALSTGVNLQTQSYTSPWSPAATAVSFSSASSRASVVNWAW